MSSVAQDQLADTLNQAAADVRKSSGWFIAFGIIQIMVGILAVSFSFSATIASVATLGVLLLIASGAQVAAAIMARSWSGFFLFLLVGILYGVAGFLSLEYPIAAAESLTLMLASVFLVGGTLRIVVSLMERFPSWGWVLVNGALTTLLGVAIFLGWPATGLWVLGAFVGIDLIVNGVTWAMIASGVRSFVGTDR
jgi:uncharacterized membrane protein HdeD (DUF308 family)